MSIVVGGGRLALPPVDRLPGGADTAEFAAAGGLAEYISEWGDRTCHRCTLIVCRDSM